LFVIAIGFGPLVHEHFEGRTTLAGIFPAMATLGAVVGIGVVKLWR
jgi:hypothetical protein